MATYVVTGGTESSPLTPADLPIVEVIYVEFDIQVNYSDGTKRTFIKDKITVIDDINKN